MKIYQNGQFSEEFDPLSVRDRATGAWFERLIGINIDWMSRIPTISPVYAPLFYTEEHPGQFIFAWQGWKLAGWFLSFEARWPFIRFQLASDYLLEKSDE
jgi:hypothetical protein